MKVFLVWVDKYGYDEYDSFVVVANSAEEIRNDFKADRWGDYYYFNEQKYEDQRWLGFSARQINNDVNNIHIEEIKTDRYAIPCVSFNAG